MAGEFIKHVRQTHADRSKLSWCGESLLPFDWAFENIDHATYNALNNGSNVACPECVRVIVEALRPTAALPVGGSGPVALSEDDRRHGVEVAMRVVVEKVQEYRLIPVVLVAATADTETTSVLPCGPGTTPELILAFLKKTVALMESHQGG